MDIREQYQLLSNKLIQEKKLLKTPKKETLIDLINLFIKSFSTDERDITDGIDLCITNEGTVEILEYLKERREKFLEKNELIVECIDFWIVNILNRKT